MSRDVDPEVPNPGDVVVIGRELAIAWVDGHESYYPFDDLRRSCPCAPCRAEAEIAAREGSLRVARGPVPGEISILRVGAVGSYAIQIVWSDGHDDGIFSFEWLRRACSCDGCSGPSGSKAASEETRLRDGRTRS